MKLTSPVPAPIEAVVTRSTIYDDKLTIKVWSEKLGRLTSPRDSLLNAGFKEGDKVLIVLNVKAK